MRVASLDHWSSHWRKGLLTEKEVARTFQKMFKDGDFSEETLSKADELLDELRPESPLRHRLGSELEELRRLHAERAKTVAKS